MKIGSNHDFKRKVKFEQTIFPLGEGWIKFSIGEKTAFYNPKQNLFSLSPVLDMDTFMKAMKRTNIKRLNFENIDCALSEMKMGGAQ